MNGSGDRAFHLVMGGLMLCSLFFDQWSARTAAWDPPRVSMITLAVAMVWMFRTAQLALRGRDDRRKVVEDRMGKEPGRYTSSETGLGLPASYGKQGTLEIVGGRLKVVQRQVFHAASIRVQSWVYACAENIQMPTAAIIVPVARLGL